MASVKDFSVEEKLSSLVRLQKIDCKLDEIQILKGELPIEVKDLEDEIEGLHARQNRVEEEKLDTRLTEINTEIQTLASFMYPKITEDQVIEFYKKQNPNKIESLESDYNKLKKEKDTIVSNIEKLDKKIDELKRIKLAEALKDRKFTNKPYPNMRNPY